jgi:hypothetical protein
MLVLVLVRRRRDRRLRAPLPAMSATLEAPLAHWHWPAELLLLRCWFGRRRRQRGSCDDKWGGAVYRCVNLIMQINRLESDALACPGRTSMGRGTFLERAFFCFAFLRRAGLRGALSCAT